VRRRPRHGKLKSAEEASQGRTYLVIGVLAVGSDPGLMLVTVSTSGTLSGARSLAEDVVPELSLLVLRGSTSIVVVIAFGPLGSSGGRAVLGEFTLELLEVEGGLLGLNRANVCVVSSAGAIP
jgi:hypothetical protein